MNIKILVATHKIYEFPEDKDLYLPVFVGAENNPELAIKSGYQADNQGENISAANPYYNELTAQYWAWKNLKDADAIGLVHYRRYFSPNKKPGLKNVLNYDQASKLLEEYDAILPTQRNYYIETNYSQYVHAHKQEPLELALEYIRSNYPEYDDALARMLASKKGHRFNMLIFKKTLFDQYNEWLFEILNHVYTHIDMSNYDDYEKRSLGFLSERLLDVWVNTNKINYTEVPFIFEEKQNWLTKGGRFIARKIRGNKK